MILKITFGLTKTFAKQLSHIYICVIATAQKKMCYNLKYYVLKTFRSMVVIPRNIDLKLLSCTVTVQYT